MIWVQLPWSEVAAAGQVGVVVGALDVGDAQRVGADRSLPELGGDAYAFPVAAWYTPQAMPAKPRATKRSPRNIDTPSHSSMVTSAGLAGS